MAHSRCGCLNAAPPQPVRLTVTMVTTKPPRRNGNMRALWRCLVSLPPLRIRNEFSATHIIGCMLTSVLVPPWQHMARRRS
eukprot:362807-Chlamydomonas_euryale.AAC.6